MDRLPARYCSFARVWASCSKSRYFSVITSPVKIPPFFAITGYVFIQSRTANKFFLEYNKEDSSSVDLFSAYS